MAGFGEPWQWTKDRLSEAASYFPTLSSTSPDDNLDIDAMRSNMNELPSMFSQSAMGIANYAASLFKGGQARPSIYDQGPQFGSSAEEMAAGRAVQTGAATPAPERAPYQGYEITPSSIAENLLKVVRPNIEGIRNIVPTNIAESIGQYQVENFPAPRDLGGPTLSPFEAAKRTIFNPRFNVMGQAAQAEQIAQEPGAATRAFTTGYLTSDIPGVKEGLETLTSPATIYGAAASEALSPIIKGLPILPRLGLGLADVGIEGGIGARAIQQAAMATGGELASQFAEDQGYGPLGQIAAGFAGGAVFGGVSAIPALRAKTFKEAAEDALFSKNKDINAALEDAIRARTETYARPVEPPTPEPTQTPINFDKIRHNNLMRIIDALPPVEDGYVRLYRGVSQNLGGEKYAEGARTFFVEEPIYAYPHGSLHYLDVPEEVVSALERRTGDYAMYPVPERFAREAIPLEQFSEGYRPGEIAQPERVVINLGRGFEGGVAENSKNFIDGLNVTNEGSVGTNNLRENVNAQIGNVQVNLSESNPSFSNATPGKSIDINSFQVLPNASPTEAMSAMRSITELADKNNVELRLTVSPYQTVSREAPDENKLRNLYKRFGFVEEGHDKMVRYAKGEPSSKPGTPIGGGAGAVDPAGYVNHPDPTIRMIAQTAMNERRQIPVDVIEEVDKATDMYKQDRPGILANFVLNTPGSRQTLGAIYRWVRPDIDAPQNVVIAFGVRDRIAKRLQNFITAGGYDTDPIKALRGAFGNDSISGSRVNVNYIGPADRTFAVLPTGERVEREYIGTLYDILSHPDQYDLSPEQVAAIKFASDSNRNLVNVINSRYYTDIFDRSEIPDSLQLPIVKAGEDTVPTAQIARDNSKRSDIELEIVRKQKDATALEDRIQRNGGIQNPRNARDVNRLANINQEISDLQAAPKVQQSVDELWNQSLNEYMLTGDKSSLFTPEKNIEFLLKGMNDSYVRDAGSTAFRLGIGGQTEQEIKDILAPGLRKQRDDFAKAVRSAVGKVAKLDRKGELDALTAKKLFGALKDVTDRIEIRGRQSGRDNEYVVRRLQNLMQDVGYIPSREEAALNSRISAITKRIEMRGGQGARGNESLQKQLENLLVRRDKIASGQLNKSSLRQLDFLGKNIAEIMDDPNLDPNDSPVVKNILADVAKAMEDKRSGTSDSVNRITENISQLIDSGKLDSSGAPAMDALSGDITNLISELSRKFGNAAIKRDADTLKAVQNLEFLRNQLDNPVDGIRARYNRIDPSKQGFTQVTEAGLNKYFKDKDAEYVRDALTFNDKETGRVLNFLGSINASVLGGDLSPIFGQQGWIAALANPVLTAKMVTRSLVEGVQTEGIAKGVIHPFRLESLRKTLVDNPQFEDYAAALGFSLRSPLAGEQSGGWVIDQLAKRSKLGGKFKEANEGLYAAIRIYQMRAMDQMVNAAVASGVPRREAVNAAADIITKTIPTSTPARFATSPARAAIQRSLFTSYAFATKPFAFFKDASTGLARRLAPFDALGKPTTREQMASNIALKMYGDMVGLAVASQALAAWADGKDEEGILDAALSAVTPSDSVNFLAMRIPGTEYRVPVGGVHRSLLRAILPKMVETPFGSIPLPARGGEDLYDFFRYRSNPALRTASELATGQRVYGGRIWETTDGPGTKLAKQLLHASLSVLPLGAAQPAQSYMEGRTLGQGAVETGAQVLGAPITIPYEKKSKGGRSIPGGFSDRSKGKIKGGIR